jgi:hypothetical protein
MAWSQRLSHFPVMSVAPPSAMDLEIVFVLTRATRTSQPALDAHEVAWPDVKCETPFVCP